MCLGGQNRIFVQIVQNELVLCICQVFYHVFQFLVDAFYLVVWLISEEYIDEIRQSFEMLHLIIYIYIFCNLCQFLCICRVIWVVDDDFFAENVAFQSDA